MSETQISLNDKEGNIRLPLLVLLLAILLTSLILWLQLPGASANQSQGDLVVPVSVPGEAEATGYSNIRTEDYVGPSVCGECHVKRYSQWQNNLHRKMNRRAEEVGAVLGDFSNVRIPYAGGVLRLERSDDTDEESPQFFMILEEEGGVLRRYQITRTIGSRYLQEYVGIQRVGPEPIGHSVYATEIRLPFGYVLSMKRWLHQQYFDSWHDREYTDDLVTHNPFEPDPSPWRGRCAWCHNTYAFEKRLARMQGPNTVGSGIEQLYVDRRVSPLSEEEKGLLDTEEFVSVGISCESCHFGGREHAEEDKAIRFAPTSPDIVAVTVVPKLAGVREDSRTINAICAQCHSVPTLLYPNGAGTRNSSEALDLLVGHCASEIKCTDCHDPHVPGPGAMAAVQGKHVEACQGCHPSLASDDAARAHSKHSEEVTCLDCHMPRIVQGLSSMIRSHRISSPAELSMLQGGVNACNVCHLDESVAWTVYQLNLRYGQHLPNRGWPARPAALDWLESETRIHRLTAAGSLGNHDAIGMQYLPNLVELLNAPNAYDRLRYMWAIEGIIGRKLLPEEYDVAADPEVRREQVKRFTNTVVNMK